METKPQNEYTGAYVPWTYGVCGMVIHPILGAILNRQILSHENFPLLTIPHMGTIVARGTPELFGSSDPVLQAESGEVDRSM